MVALVSGVQAKPIEPIKEAVLSTGRVPEENQAPEEDSASQIVIFQKSSQTPVSFAMSTLTTAKPAAEHTRATSVSTYVPAPISTISSEGRFSGHTGGVHVSGTSTELASALSGAESNERGGDKKDEEGNTFVAARKTMEDLRLEALQQDDIFGSILSIC